MEKQTVKVWEVEAVAIGIKRRERKVKRHFFPIVELPDKGEKPDLADLTLYKVDAMNQVQEHLRAWQSVELRFRPMEISTYEGGAVMRGHLMFDPREFRIEVAKNSAKVG